MLLRSAMRRVKLLTSTERADCRHWAGDQVSVDVDTAERWIALGIAEAVEISAPSAPQHQDEPAPTRVWQER